MAASSHPIQLPRLAEILTESPPCQKWASFPAVEEAGLGSPRPFGRRVAVEGRGADHREMLAHRLSMGGTTMAQVRHPVLLAIGLL